MKIYLVTGEMGEYSDRMEWLVCAYASRELAEKHMRAANAWIEDTKSKYDDWFDFRNAVREKETSSPYDPGLEDVYSLDGVEYCVSGVELRDELPKLTGA